MDAYEGTPARVPLRATEMTGNAGVMGSWVYPFGPGEVPVAVPSAAVLGGKGAGLAAMCSLGLPVPPGFTIPAAACNAILSARGVWPDGMAADVDAGLNRLSGYFGEGAGARRFGDASRPLLVSVRSGAAVSMPGMMDTVLNLGLTREGVAALARISGDERFAWDTWRRFISHYSDVVLGIDIDVFSDLADAYAAELGPGRGAALDAAQLQELCRRCEALVEEETGELFPQDPHQQLRAAVNAVFRSWGSVRAATFRRLNNIDETSGTAVTVQAMVFGNMGGLSSSGVVFTRDPSTGEKRLYGEYLPQAQGEDIVSGAVTPRPIHPGGPVVMLRGAVPFSQFDPATHAELVRCTDILERQFRDAQDVEFTVEQGKLWLLQTRTAKRTAQAAIRMAVEMASEGIISRKEAVCRIDPMSIEQLLHPTVDPLAEREVLAVGLPASPGAATGELVFTSEDAEALKARQRPAVLVRLETSPEDIHGMHAADGIVTARGGMTSHAAVVARGMGKPCVTGAGNLRIDVAGGKLMVFGKTFRRGDVVTVDGTSGQLLAGAVALREPQLSGHFAQLMGWADELRQLGVRANAETPQDARFARAFGADGIGLCRTEQMLAGSHHILAIQRMILCETAAERREAIHALLPMQRRELEALFVEMHGLPVTVRMFDPPLHEFLPRGDKEIRDVAFALNLVPDQVRARVEEYEEYNPTLGHRGVRLAISYPEIAEMQARAIFEATLLAAARTGAPVIPEIMVPLVAIPGEFAFVKAIVDRVADEVRAAHKASFAYEVGAIVELPRAALMAGKIAAGADFLSFGTNDLTQTTYGISRDDSVSFLIEYQKKGIIKSDPFVTLDQEGVGELVKMAIDRARAVRPGIVTAMSGEHGGDPETIHFCQKIGLGYVSCSPFRVPIARLAAAQAAVKAGL